MTTVHAFAAHEPGAPLEPFEYELDPIGAHDVDVAVEHCGICHSDLSMLNNEWQWSEYPLVPGHEVTGIVQAVGEYVTNIKIGDRVGLGWHAGYCMTCPQCMSGDHNMCPDGIGTIVGRYGGFADLVRAQSPAVIKLPDGIDSGNAGPLFCGGITVFTPFTQFELQPTGSVGVVGIGGLGHLALQFARAWGCHVTAFTSSASKQQQAIDMGAHETIDSRDEQAIEAAAGRFDMLIITVNVPLNWNAYIAALKPRGRLHFVGAVLAPLDLAVFPMIGGQKSVSGSPVGSPATIARMLEFCARHNIKPVTEHFPMSDVNAAFDHLRAGKARYRIVLDR